LSEPSLLVVVQRYGDVPGGAEAHARSVVQRLQPHFAIEVATTNSTDYLTWKADLTAGLDQIDGVTVRRFPVERPRAWNFKLYERRAFRAGHTLDDERAFIDAQGPYAPELLDFLFKHGRDYDHVLFFTYIYYPTVLGLPLVPERAVLVPTAHEESAIGLSAYKPVFHGPRAIAYNTEEERRMVWRRFRNERVSNEIVGVGIDVPAERNSTRFREKYGITGPYLLYVGRIGVSKGSRELFAHYERWRASDPAHDVSLVLVGDAEISIPRTSGVVHVGRLGEQDKWDALAGARRHGAACRSRSRVPHLGGVRRDLRALHGRSRARRSPRPLGRRLRRADVHLAARRRDLRRSVRGGPCQAQLTDICFSIYESEHARPNSAPAKRVNPARPCAPHRNTPADDLFDRARSSGSAI